MQNLLPSKSRTKGGNRESLVFKARAVCHSLNGLAYECLVATCESAFVPPNETESDPTLTGKRNNMKESVYVRVKE